MADNIIAQRIKHLRELKGWTQQELADRSGISRSYLGELERDVSQPTAVVLKRVADAFQVPIDIFFEDTRILPLQSLDHLFPEDVKEFLRDRAGLPYLEVAIEARNLDVSPAILRQIIHAIREDKRNSEKTR